MKSKQAVIIIPGLGDDASKLEWVTKHWDKSLNIVPIVYSMGWKNKKSFHTILLKLLLLIDKVYKQYKTLSLIGTSAGGSAVINAFCEKKNKIYKVINVCGRLRRGENVFPSLDTASIKSPSFKESVLLCEKNIQNLTSHDKLKILTIRPLFDEVVPTSCVPISGAENKIIISLEHVVSIILCFTIYVSKIVNFLKTK